MRLSMTIDVKGGNYKEKEINLKYLKRLIFLQCIRENILKNIKLSDMYKYMHISVYVYTQTHTITVAERIMLLYKYFSFCYFCLERNKMRNDNHVELLMHPLYLQRNFLSKLTIET